MSDLCSSNPDVKVFLTALDYSETTPIVFQPVKQLQSVKDSDKPDADSRIRFSLLLQIAQKQEMPESELAVELIKYDKPTKNQDPQQEGKRSQKLSRLHLKDIPLGGLGTPSNVSDELLRDHWTVRQYIRINFSAVPTKGPGSYAVVAYQKKKGEKLATLRGTPLLDCCYFTVC